MTGLGQPTKIFVVFGTDITLTCEKGKWPIDQKTAGRYIDFVFRLIDSWKEEYIDTTILDGNSWELTIKYKDGGTKTHK